MKEDILNTVSILLLVIAVILLLRNLFCSFKMDWWIAGSIGCIALANVINLGRMEKYER